MRVSLWLASAAICVSSSAFAKTFSFPHVLESSGRITSNGQIVSSWAHADTGISEGDIKDVPPQGTTQSAKWAGTLLLNGSSSAKVVLHDLSFVSIPSPATGGYQYTLSMNIDGEMNGQGFVVNSHTGPFDLSVFGFDPQPITVAAFSPPPPSSGLIFTFPDDIVLVPALGGSDSIVVNAGSTLSLQVPEPAFASLLGVAGLALLRRRK